MRSKLVPLSEIKLNPSNPRSISEEKFKKLVESIKKFPKMLEIRPIVVNDDDIVLGGNMRLRACSEAGLKEVPVVKASDLTPEEQREFIIKDNVGFGDWDFDLLANDYDIEELEDWGLDVDFDTPEEPDPFDDEGITDEGNKYGVIVFCSDETEQALIFEKLSAEGYDCKVVAT